MLVNCSAQEFDSCYNLFQAKLTKSASYVTCVPFLCCADSPSVAVGAVQDEGLVCGGSADSNAGLSEHSTRTTSINL